MSEIDRLLDGAPEYNPDAAKKPKAMAAAPRSESDELLKDAPSQARGFTGVARDLAAWGVKSAIGVPELAVGLADIPTGGRVGKFLENKDGAVGFRPKQAREAVNEWHSDATKDAQRKFQEAEGIGGKLQAAIENPSNIAGGVIESLGAMGAGGLAARGLLAGTRLGQMGTSAAARVAAAGGDDAAQAAARIAGNAKGAALAGAAGEGLTMAGSAAEQIRQETEDGLLTPQQTALAAGTGVIGGAFGALGGRLANRLGIGDAETMLAQGARGMSRQFADDAATAAARAAANPLVAQAAAKGIPRKMIEGAISEGLLEELPQSVSEQLLQNLALDKPWHEELDAAIVLGTLSGGAMGAGAAGYRGFMEPGRRDVPPAPPAPAPAPPMLGNQPDPPVIFPDGTIGRSAEVEAYINSLPEDQRVEARAKLRGLGPQPAPAPAPIKPSEAMGLNPAQGSLSSAAAVAVDSGVTGQMEQAAAEVQQLEQTQAQRRADSPVLDYADLDDADRAAYDDYFNTVSEQTDDHLAAAMLDDDIPDFGAESNISEVEFLRRLGASEQEILDAIQAASPAGGPQAGAFGATETQAHVTDSAQPAAGADQGPGSSQEAAKSIADSAYQPIASALQAELDAEAADDIPDTAFARVTEDAGEPDIPATTKGQNDGDQAFEAQQTQPSRAQGGAETGDAAAAQGVPAAGAGGAGVQAAGLTDGATADVRGEQPAGRGERGGADAGAGVDAGVADGSRAGAGVDAAGVGRAGPVSLAPDGAGAGAKADGAVDALRQQLRAIQGKIIAAAPATMGVGGGDIEAAMRSRKVPVTLKAQHKALVDQIRAAEAQPQGATSNVAETSGTVSAEAGNQSKTAATTTADTPAATATENEASSAQPVSAGAGIDAETREKAIERVKSGSAFFFSEPKASAFITDNGLDYTHEVVKDKRRFVVQEKAEPGPAPAWQDMTPDQRRRARLESEIATGKTNNGGVEAELRPKAIAERRAQLEAMGDAGRLDGAATEQPVSSLFTGEADPNNSAPLRELDGFKVGDVVDVPGRTIGRSTIEILFTRDVNLPMNVARIVSADGKRLDVVTSELAPVDSVAAVAAAANEAATSPENDLPEPTDAQKAAGNYKMGHLSGDAVQGLNITIENPKGSTRSGKDSDGETWQNTMAAHYGYVKGSEAADGDHVDIFVGPDAATAPTVWVVDQVNPDGTYDEAKALFGFNTENEAVAAYKGSYDKGWKVGPITAMSVDEFKVALTDGRLKKPLAKTAKTGEPLPPAAKKAATKKPSAEQTRAKADLMNALADLGDILGKGARLNIAPEQEQKLLPVLTRVLDAAFRLGYHKFKDAAKFSLDQIRQHLGDEAADALTLDHMQGAYIAMSGGKQGVDTKRAVIDVETKAEIEAHEANTAEPEADTIEAPQDAPLRTSDGAPTAATGRVDRPSQGALGGIPADPVQGTSGGREAGGIAARGRDADQRGNADPDGPGGTVARSVGDGARDVPVPTGGRRSGPVRGRGNASGGRVSGTAPGDDAATATGRPGRLSEPAQPELGGINPAGGPNLAPNAPPIESPQLTDFTITDDFALGEGGQKTKFKANVAAIRLAKELDANPNRVATQEEQRVLARYVGWGGLAQAFDANNKDWSREHAELKELLGEDEYADAARSTRYAHYTSREVIVDGVYAALRRFGFTGGKTLEAGAGVGNFLGLMPADMRSASRFTAIERDRLSSTIARHLYPQQNVQRADFTQFKGADGYFDAAVGNPPFASDTQTDQSGRKHLSGLSLHNYFFAKAVDMLRPGGVMAQVVTNSFLDAKGDTARRYIGERTVFLGAIRLPNNAFSKNAGTEVTTDIIFLQKRPDADIGSKKAKQDAKSWLESGSFTDKSGKTVALNQYFIDHPEMMLGDFGAHGTMYGPDQPALVARTGQDTSALLREAVQRLPEGVYTPAAEANTASQHKAAMEALKNPAVQEGGYFIDGDRLMRREQDVAGEAFAVQITPEMPWTEKQALGESRFDRIRRLAQLRTTLRELIAAEMGSDDARIGALRAQLNEQYDAFQAEHGYISGRSTKLVFEDDPDYPLLLALESDYNPGISVPAAKKAGVKAVKPSAKKAPIFSRRVVAAREAVRKVDTPIDALAVSMAERGRLDAGYIGDLLGRDPQEVLQELASGEKPAIFRDPATDEYVLRDAYLSGNVRAKLAQAIAAGERANVRALEEVQPEDVPASEIVARIGSPWVPKSVYEDFARHLFGDETEANVRYIKESGSFIAAITPGNAVAHTSTYGTQKMDGSAILQALLNNRPVRVTFRDSEGKTHVDQEGTDQANEKAQAIRDKFQDWLFADGDRAEVLVRAYNDTNNNYVTRVYDGERMTFPGKVPDEIVKFRRHQRNAIARTVQDRTALYDHVVGAGKAQPLDSKLLTPRGWVRMGDIKVGDLVITQDGTKTLVEAIFPQGDKEIFRVTFSDGSSTECCDEHLWLTQTYRERTYSQRGKKQGKNWACGEPKVRNLAEIRQTLTAPHRGAKNHSIPMVGIVQFAHQEVPLDPYLLGALIGDGHIGEKAVSLSGADDEVFYSLSLPEGVRARENGDEARCKAWHFIGTESGKNPMLDAMRSLGLSGKLSHEKFVPDAYKFNSPDVRLAVLRGLMDTDGWVEKAGKTTAFTTTSRQLANDVAFLVQSFGGVALETSRTTNYTHNGEKKDGRESYRLTIKMPPDINPFHISRKRDAVVAKSSYAPARYIVAVESVGMKPAQCIRVAHESHLYVTDDFIVTHNTYTVIASAMELRRTGLAKKPMIAVPNHLVKQWAADFYRLYPGANILTATKDDFKRQNRRKFLAKAATGDWDAIIIAHSSFGFIRSAPEFEEQFNRKEIAKIVAAIESVEADADSDKQQKRRTVKQLEGLKERLENRIKSLRDRPMDDLLDFDQLGVDQLFVDEFHLFKNLMFSTKMQNVQGLGDPTGSQRAYDMLLKIGQIFAKNGRDQGFVAATGTPVSNSLAEMYHMMRYLMPTQMEALGFTSFDAWANTFASVEQVWMQKSSGEGFKASSRMSTFVNTPELLKMFDQVSDTVTMDNIKAAFAEENGGAEFPLPKIKGGRRTPISLEKTPAQEAYMKELAERAKVVEARKGPPEKGEDNVLVIMSDGRKAAMDMRLVNPDQIEREPGGRVDRASDEIMARYRQYAKQKGTQLVFSDLGTPVKHAKAELKEYQALRDRIDAADDDVRASAALGDEDAMDKLQDADAAQEELDAKGPDWLDAVRAAERGFSVYDDLRAALIEKGVPPQEIAFIHDANTDEQKAALFRKVNSGEVRVLMGSTQKMGAGTNVQERLVALHHLDVPWKPSDVEQREGRIERQGNKLAFGPEALPGFEVEILGYVTQDTLDMRMWQIQETKLKMINQLRTRNVARELDNAFEDMEMSAGEMQAAATGNTDLLKEIQLRSDVKKLEQRKRAFDASRADLESRRRRNAQQLQSLPGQIDAARAPGDKVAAYRKEADARLADFKANIDGKDYTDWREAQAYLREHDDRRIRVENDQGEMVEKAAPLDVTINGERYTARAAMADAFSQLRGDVDPIIWSVGDNTMRRRTEIERAIRQPVVDAIAGQNEQRAGSIAGFDVVIEGHVTANGNQLDVALMDGDTAVDQRQFTVSDSGRAPAQVIKSVEGMLNSMQHAVSDLEARLKRAKKEAADLDGTAAVGEWPDAEKLEKARAAHREVLKRLAGESQAAEPVKDGGDNFGARRRAAQGTPTDRAVMDMLREGREAKDVLRLIAGTSRSRLNRQVARLLLRTGVTPKVEALAADGLGKDKRGFNLLAKYNRDSNTISLTEGAGYMAEQIMLHELIHAATLRALDRKGLASLQMRRLFEHVQKHGGLAGTYGMKNAGEFVSEAFTNPDFQRELRKIKGVQDGGATKTAWDGFIRILRSILGLRSDSTDALSQALQIGVAVMRDQYRMGNRGERGGHNAYMATRNVAGQDSASDDSDTHMGAPTHGYLDGKPHNPPTEQLSAEQRKLIVDTFNANTSGEKVTTTGAVESSGDIGAKSRAFQALAAAEGWTVHRDQIGAKYFNVNKGGRDGINIAVRVSDHSNVNRGIHFKESAINLAPNDGRAAFDDFESALWKLRNAGEDEDGNLTFGGDEPDYFFGAADVRELKDSAMQRVTDTFAAEGTVSLWHKTVGTMRNLAERSPAFKPVFEAAQRFIDDVALMANDAADRAPRVLPRVDTWRDLAKKPISAADNKAIAKPLFEGTLLWARDEQKKPVLVADLQKRYASKTADEKAQLMLRAGTLDPKVLRMWQGMQKDQFDKLINSRFESEMLNAGVVWSDKELTDIFNATPNQISLYRETRAAIDRSIDMTARADMLRALGEDFAGLRDRVLDQDSLGNAMELLIAEIRKRSDAAPDQGDRFMALHNAVVDRATKARDLMDAGYMPLSRFGQYTVDVVGEGGERLFFGMYESKGDANRARVALATEFKGATVTQGTMSQQDYKLFAGITPESLELFGNMLGLDGDGDKARDAAFQEYLQRAKANQSALKRLIHRQGIAGFGEDVGRVLASFVYSNARLAAGGLNAGTMDRAISNIPKREGELRDVAMGLRDYIKDPQEEGQAIRGMLFAQYLGGSVASAFVNMTQPFAVTIPWLSQYGGIKSAGAQMTRALNDMRRSLTDKGFKYEADLAAALQSAQDDGVVSPQEIHQLMAQARGTGSLRVGDGTRTGDARAAAANAWERTKVAWGQPFALAEQFNRRSTFIAAYRTAKERGMRDPAEFARRAVLETQFLYSKANKPRWARGTVGGTLFTFKTYSVSYLELMNRMWTQGDPEGKRAVGWALASLMLMGGAGGLPFMEDLEDLIDGIAQLMGYNVSTKQQRQRALRAVLGKEFADFMEHGVSGLPGAPVDVSGRLGMGNLLPGTGLLLTKQNRERDLLEVAGPAGDLVARGFTGVRKALTGDFGGAAMEVAPTAVRNLAKGADMAATGIYKDTKGYKVIDTTMLEAAAKAAGFQPRSVAEVQEANSFMMRSRSFYTQTSAEIKAQWAQALFNKDDAALERVRARLAAWNKNNPDQPITVKMPDVWKRVREMSKDRTQRIADTAPKALRQQMREMAREAD